MSVYPVPMTLGRTSRDPAAIGTQAIAGAAGVSYSAEAYALFARFTTPPDEPRKAVIDALIVSLKAAGIWAKLDALYLMAAADSQAARRNWIGDQYNLTAASSPVFATDRGYTGDGAAARLNTGFTPSSAVTPKFVQDGACFGLYSRTAAASAGTLNFDMATPTSGGNRADLRCRQSTGGVVGYLNSGAGASGTATDGSGYFAVLRSTSALTRVRRNAVELATAAASTSTGVPVGQFVLLSDGGTNFSARQLAASFIGGALTDAESNTLATAITTYLSSIGAN